MNRLLAKPRRGPSSSFEYIEGWGMAVGQPTRVLRPRSTEEILECFQIARAAGKTLTLRGGGNSYGDASCAESGYVLDISALDRVLSFDAEHGVATLEPGVTIEKLWKTILPLGFWPKVVSGTMFPTVAGALAANIHGKNNFAVGTIGDACVEFDIVLPTGEVRTCNRERNADLFHAAIGGFGMLGCFSRVVLKTKKVHSGNVQVLGKSTRNLREMMDYFEAHKATSDYLVGWVDCFPGGDGSGRGLIHDARNLGPGEDSELAKTLTIGHQELPANILGLFPKSQVWRILRLFNHDLGMRSINAAKYVAGMLEGLSPAYLQSHAGFSFLLDYVPNWKWAYGRERGQRGLIQYQPFVPHAVAHDVHTEILARCRRAGQVPYLGVFKRHRPDPFWLTHAVDGWSFALDFKVDPVRRAELWKLCDELTELVISAGGRFYFAKDLVVAAEDTARFLPHDRLAAFAQLKRECDPDTLLEGKLYRRAFRDWIRA